MEFKIVVDDILIARARQFVRRGGIVLMALLTAIPLLLLARSAVNEYGLTVFSPGSVISSDAVNANFDLLAKQSDSLQSSVDSLEAAITVDGNNSVGIGSTSPSANLDVKGNLSKALSGIVSTAKGSAVVTGSDTKFMDELKVGDAIGIGAEVFTVAVIKAQDSLTIDPPPTTSLGGALAYTDRDLLSIKNGDGAGKVVVDKSGNVGVGTLSPGQRLDVNGNIQGSMFFIKSFTLPADGNWYSVAGAGGQWGRIAYLYDNPSASAPVISSGEIMVINDNYALRMHHKTSQYGSNNNLQFARSGNTAETGKIWVKATGTTSGRFYITENQNCNLYLDGTKATSPPSGVGQVIYPQLGGDMDYFSDKVGIGTTNPTARLEVAGGGDILLKGTGGDAGDVVFQTGTGEQRGRMWTNSEANVLNLSSKDNSPDITIVESGNVGIGTTSPQYKLDVAGTVRADNISVTSDARFKKDISPLQNALEGIKCLQGVSYLTRDPALSADLQIGLIAQEVEECYPEVVATDDQGYKSVSYDRLVAPLIEALKAQQRTLDVQEARLQRLEAHLTASHTQKQLQELHLRN